MDQPPLPTADQDTLDYELAAAQAAIARGQHDRALRIWTSIRERYPDHQAAYHRAAEVLLAAGDFDEAEEILSEARARVTADLLGLATLGARVAVRRGDTAEAVKRWQLVRSQFPGHPVGFVGVVESLREAGRLDEAEAEFAVLMERFPMEQAAPVLRASLADARQHWPKAAALWATVRDEKPDEVTGYVRGARALQQAGQLDEADAVLADAVERFPKSVELALQYAEIASHRRQWAAAVMRWVWYRQRYPTSPIGYARQAEALREMGRRKEAAALLDEAAACLSDQPEIATEVARNADGEARLVHELLSQGRADDAEELLRSAIERYPNHVPLAMAHARVAGQRHDWHEALRRWRDAGRRFPDVAEINQRIFESEMRLAETSLMVAGDAPSRATGSNRPAHDERARMRELVMRFESLGGTLQGCEFGLFQRAFGAEPLGLLRWTEMAPNNVIDALEAGLEGVGLPEQTELNVHQTPDGPEYFTRDKRFLMSMHTFVMESEVPYDAMFQRCCRRLQYLRDKLLEDLHSVSKIFVYKITWRLMKQEELVRMHAALRQYGDNTLLYVQHAVPGKAPGTVELVQPGLMMGYIDRFSVSPTGENLGQATDSWAAICECAFRLWIRSTGHE